MLLAQSLQASHPRPVAPRRRAANRRCVAARAGGAQLLGDTAVVIGASFSGMLCAAHLSPHFERVLVLDRDAALPGVGSTTAAPRVGVAQSTQPHILFARGLRELEAAFPGLSEALRRDGALPVHWHTEFCLFLASSWAASSPLGTPPRPDDITSFTCSRCLLETAVRRRAVALLPNVEWRTGARVTGVASSGGAVCGVILADGTHLHAALTVDAAGRGSNAGAWLRAAGLTDQVSAPALPANTVDAGLRYATRIFQRDHDAPRMSWKVMMMSCDPPHRRRGAYIAQLEGNRLVATLSGFERDAPPLQDAGWRAFAATLPGNGAFLEALENATAEPGDAAAFAATSNVWRSFSPIPGMVHVGDAALALCPVYGQGVTAAAMGAAVLRDALSAAAVAVAAGAEPAFALAALPAAMDAPTLAALQPLWSLAAAQDALFSSAAVATHAPYASALTTSPLAWFSAAMRRQATHDSETWQALLAVTHQVAAPQTLFAPRLVAPMLLAECGRVLRLTRG